MSNWPERTLKLKASVGSGDLATIYVASDVERGQAEFAVAILHYDLKDVEGVAAAMSKRIAASKGVDHPGLVRCEGVFRVSDRPAVVMEMVDGKDLARLAKRRNTPAAIAARIGLELTSFLVAAKAKGMVHGLLGPARVCIDNGGQVRVMGAVTPTGTMVDVDHPIYREERGTSRYAAPELMGGLLTTPNDVYAIGGILTLLISGRWPQRPA
ncbi:MAG: protein kinase domain-containing protein, partial [Myxococcota bacterium]